MLDNEQRAQVGKVYSNDAFEARKLGAAMVSSRISEHISSYFIHKPQHYCPLVYCWRGGQRSHSLATVLSHVGFNVLLMEGGYRTYRKRVVSDLDLLPQRFKYKVVTGELIFITCITVFVTITLVKVGSHDRCGSCKWSQSSVSSPYVQFVLWTNVKMIAFIVKCAYSPDTY